MRVYVLALVFICMFAIGAILLLRPDPAVEFEAELSYLEPEEALHRLTFAATQGSLSTNLHLLHARLAMASGDLIAARSAYEQVLIADKANPAVYDELSDLAALEGDLAEAAEFKSQALEISPDQGRRQQLGFLFRLSGDRDREIALLETTQTRRLDSFERWRLAELYIEAGEVGAYRELLTLMSRMTGDDALVARRQLLELNIESGDAASALVLARDWTTKDPENRKDFAVYLTVLVGKGATAEAIALAQHAIESEPGIGPVPVEVFISSGHGGVGRQIQQQWLSTDTELDDEDWQALARTAERTGDLSALRRALARDTSEDSPVPPEAFLQFLRYQGARSLLAYSDRMNPELFESAPLLGAAWFGWHRHAPTAYRYLVEATAKPLSDWDRAIWMSIADDLRGTPFYRELLAGASQDAGIRRLLQHRVVAPVPNP